MAVLWMQDGNVITFGDNSMGQLGHSLQVLDGKNKGVIWLTPRVIELLNKQPGETAIGVALGDLQLPWSIDAWKKQKNKVPNLVWLLTNTSNPLPGTEIHQVVASASTFHLLDGMGNIYSAREARGSNLSINVTNNVDIISACTLSLLSRGICATQLNACCQFMWCNYQHKDDSSWSPNWSMLCCSKNDYKQTGLMHMMLLHGGSKHSIAVMQEYNNTKYKCNQCSSTFFDDRGYSAGLTYNKVIEDFMQVVQQTTWIHQAAAAKDENTLVGCLAGWWIDWLDVNFNSHLVVLDTLVC
eukprot:13181720-Ditylum_brightwellii.AAC.1